VRTEAKIAINPRVASARLHQAGSAKFHLSLSCRPIDPIEMVALHAAQYKTQDDVRYKLSQNDQAATDWTMT
jgi:hypothetical protein